VPVSDLSDPGASWPAAPADTTLEHQLSMDILSGRLEPGARLRMSEMMARYSVGMSPIREALARLSGTGLVQLARNRGYTVATMSLAELDDIADTRLRLECMAFEMALRRGGPPWEAEILAAHHRLNHHPRTRDVLIDEPWEALHRDFHLALIAACASPTLVGFCRTLLDHFDRYRRIAVQTSGMHPAMGGDHSAIVEAVLARRTDDAVAFLDRHIRDARGQIRALWQRPDAPTPPPPGQRGRAAAAPRGQRRPPNDPDQTKGT